jgi:hypothetical protein
VLFLRRTHPSALRQSSPRADWQRGGSACASEQEVDLTVGRLNSPGAASFVPPLKAGMVKSRSRVNPQSTIRKENPGRSAWLFDKNRQRVLPFQGIPRDVPRKAAKRGVLSMLSKLSLVLTCGVLASSFSMSAHASSISPARPQPAPSSITLVRDGCGLGFHWAPCGCIRNYTACPVVVAPVAPVVVAPQYAPPVVVTPAVCPYGYYLGPYGRCLPY